MIRLSTAGTYYGVHLFKHTFYIPKYTYTCLHIHDRCHVICTGSMCLIHIDVPLLESFALWGGDCGPSWLPGTPSFLNLTLPWHSRGKGYSMFCPSLASPVCTALKIIGEPGVVSEWLYSEIPSWRGRGSLAPLILKQYFWWPCHSNRPPTGNSEDSGLRR